MLKSVRLNTCPVVGSRDANTVDAISAAFVLRLAGIFLIPALTDDDGIVGVP